VTQTTEISDGTPYIIPVDLADWIIVTIVFLLMSFSEAIGFPSESCADPDFCGAEVLT
jgi:hypothetical protein